MAAASSNRTTLRQFLFVFAATAAMIVVFLRTDLLARVSYTIEKGRIRAWREQLPTPAQLDESFRSARAMAEVVAPAVVYIDTQARVPVDAADANGPLGRLHRFLLDRPKKPSSPGEEPNGQDSDQDSAEAAEPGRDGASFLARGLGSGFIFDAERGHVLTNAHVIDGADRINVHLADGRRVQARVIGSDESTDLAVLAIDARGLHELHFGDSRSVQVGDDVFAVGNPFGLDGTFSRGIISAKDRSNIRIHDIQYQGFLQTDAVINPGNSGGPLVNLRGEVVGINTAIATQSGHYDGVGFAIPAWRAVEVLPQLLAGGAVVRGYLGVQIRNIEREAAPMVDGATMLGVRVEKVVAGSAAERGGMKAGDLILSADGQRVTTTAELMDRVAAVSPGTPMRIEVWRDGARLSLSITLDRRPPRV